MNLLDRLLEARAAKRPAPICAGSSRTTRLWWWPARRSSAGRCRPPCSTRSGRRIAATKARQFRRMMGRLFIQVFNPPLRLIVVGAVHIAQTLVPMARLTGYDVTVVDPRRAFASDARFPDVDVRTDWPDEALDGAARPMRAPRWSR